MFNLKFWNMKTSGTLMPLTNDDLNVYLGRCTTGTY